MDDLPARAYSTGYEQGILLTVLEKAEREYKKLQGKYKELRDAREQDQGECQVIEREYKKLQEKYKELRNANEQDHDARL